MARVLTAYARPPVFFQKESAYPAVFVVPGDCGVSVFIEPSLPAPTLIRPSDFDFAPHHTVNRTVNLG